jgi:hypothetical protein
MSAQRKLEECFFVHLGEIIETDTLAKVAGIHDYQRRITELSREDGLSILHHNDREHLHPGRYLLETVEST